MGGLIRRVAGRIWRAVPRRRAGARGPTQLFLDPTYKCNLRCISCHSPQVATSFDGETALSFDECATLLAQFKENGGRELHIYGGEPLLVRHVPDVLAFAKSIGLSANLTTNGLLLDAAKAKKLVDIGLGRLTISIDGVGEVYERIRGRGRYPQLVAGIRTFQQLNAASGSKTPVAFHVTVMRQNVGSLAEVLHLAKEFNVGTVSYAVAVRVDSSVDSRTQGFFETSFKSSWNHWEVPGDILITPAQLPRLKADVEWIRDESARLGIRVSMDPALADAGSHPLTEGRFRLTKTCPVAEKAMFLGPSGYIALCPMLTHYSVANIRETSIVDYWSGNVPLQKLRVHLRRGDYLPVCESCCNHSGLI